MSGSGGDGDPRYRMTVSSCGAVSLAKGHIEALESLGERVMEEIERQGLARRPLPRGVEVSLVDDQAIAQVHGEFLNDPSPTDVITFPYGQFGEILISVETAIRQGAEYGRSPEAETSLYLIHGLLHLAGYTDHEDEEREEMATLQETLLALHG